MIFWVFAGEVLGALCKKVGPETYGDVKDQILQGIRSNLEREMPSGEEDDGKDDVEKLVQKLSSSPGCEKVHCNSSTGLLNYIKHSKTCRDYLSSSSFVLI